MKQRLRQRWENYSATEKRLLSGLAALVTMALVWLALLTPLLEYQQKGKEKMLKAAEDLAWMADQKAHFNYMAPQGLSADDSTLAQRVSRALAEYQPGLIIADAQQERLALTVADDTVDFLLLMRFLIYLQAGFNISVEEIDLSAADEKGERVRVNQLILRDGASGQGK